MTADSLRVLFVEDALLFLEEMVQIMRGRGYCVLAASRPDEAVDLINEATGIDVAVLDVRLPMEGSRKLGLYETAGGENAGLVLARELRRRFAEVPIIFWTDKLDRQVREAVVRMGNARLLPKSYGPGPVLDMIEEGPAGFSGEGRPHTFIVHGHDEQTMGQFKRYLEQELGFPEPVVLRNTPSHGRTIIEKLESHTYTVDKVFVLLTPDDRVAGPDGKEAEIYRSRQNVIFELGYFLGALGRGSGRVVLLYRRPIELPSDIGGMVSIDITDGLEAADEEIRQEVREWL